MGTTRIFNRTVPFGSRSNNPNSHVQEGKVFANDPALETSRSKAKVFPEGAVLVREKRKNPGDEKPELLAVMIKRGVGFNPKGGDWEFLVINGARTKVKLHQKTGDCLDCHQSQHGTDFVYPLK
jgi:hypothetical protein